MVSSQLHNHDCVWIPSTHEKLALCTSITHFILCSPIESSPGGFLKEVDLVHYHVILVWEVPWTMFGCYRQISPPKYQILNSRCSHAWDTDLFPKTLEHVIDTSACVKPSLTH